MTPKEAKMVLHAMRGLGVLGFKFEIKDSIFITKDQVVKASCGSVEEMFGWMNGYAAATGKEDAVLEAIYRTFVNPSKPSEEAPEPTSAAKDAN